MSCKPRVVLKLFMSSWAICCLFILLSLAIPKKIGPNQQDDNNQLFICNRTTQMQWIASPNTRGTSSIISSCVLTLALCLWSAIHLNIPHKSWAKWQWVERSLWVIGSMIFTEFMLFLSLEQNMVASRLSKRIGQILRKQEIPEINDGGWKRFLPSRYSTKTALHINNDSIDTPAEVAEWTMTHSFYTLMGGFVLETGPNEKPYLPEDLTRVVLTVDGLELLAAYAPEMIPGLPAFSGIMDKSKANKFSKALVCIQTLWFCLQAVERHFRGLRVCLLELAAIARCVHAIFIYVLWWKKPFGIEEPTAKVVTGEKMNAILSYMWICSGDYPEFDSISFCPTVVEKHCSVFGERLPSEPISHQIVGHPESCKQCCILGVTAQRRGNISPTETFPKPRGTIISLSYSQYLSVADFSLRAESIYFTEIIVCELLLNSSEQIIHLEAHDVQRWCLASLAITKYGLPIPNLTDSNYVTSAAPSFLAGRDVIEHKDQMLWRLALIFAMEVVVYFWGWNYAFSANSIRTTWHWCVLISLSPFFCTSLYFVMSLYRMLPEQVSCCEGIVQSRQPSSVYKALYRILVLISGVSCAAYLLAKFILVTTALDDVFYLPESAYQVGPWSSYLPHV